MSCRVAAARERVRPTEAVRLDPGALENLRQLGGEEFLEDLIDTFLAEATGQLTMLRRSIEQGEADELRRAAHTLKSNGATFGAETFAELCRDLEERAKNGRLDGAAELADRIGVEFARLVAALEALSSRPPS